MKDRELLEMAAKAAGYDIRSDAWACGPSGMGQTLYMGNRGPSWNPLTDDGDALRLAVRLDLSLHINGSYSATAEVFECEEPIIMRKEYCNDETKYAATRRAIVRAAAEIGKKMS